jgi:nucleoporin GLE1
MAGSSPARRSTHWSIPDRTRPSDYLSEDRNTELSHQEALAAAHAEHERVRLAAIRVIQHHEHQLTQQRLQEEEQQILAKQKREVERLEQEKKLREEQQRLRDLEARSVPKLPPKPPPEAVAKPQLNGPSSAANENTAPTSASPAQQAATAKLNPFGPSAATPSATPQASQTNGDGTQAPNSSAAPLTASNTPSPFAKPTAPIQNAFTKPISTPTINGLSAAGPAKPVAATSPMQPRASPAVDHFARIHQNLKKLRAGMVEQTKTNPQLKKRMGDMRRELRKSVGQLTSEKGANRQQVSD